MIISRTPFRVSFFGGGTDYPEWYLKEGGAVLSTTIDKYLYISARYLPPFFTKKHRIVWSKVESVSSFSEVEHPVIREGLSYLGFTDKHGFDIHYQADLPARSGMGSSSAFAVGFINAMSALKNTRVSKHELSRMAIELEHDVLNEAVGAQDQVAAAHGGLNRIEFLRSGEVNVDPIVLSPSRLSSLEDSLLLVYTGVNRFASEVAAKVIENLPNKRTNLERMRAMVDEGVDILTGDRLLEDIGHLLDEAWQLKKDISQGVSSEMVDDIYAKARKAGAVGGKLLGAGESGFMVFFVPPDKQAAMRKALSDYLFVPFKFSWQGSSIIHFDPEEYAGKSSMSSN